MFIISTDNKLYYRGENKNGRGCVGNTNRVLEFEEIEPTDSQGNSFEVSDIVDFIEYYNNSAFLFKDGSVRYTDGINRKLIKANVSDIIQICSNGSNLFLLNKNGEIFKTSSGTFNVTQITTNYGGTPIKKVRKIGSSSISRNTSNYGLAYYIDEDNDLYTYGIDFVNAVSRSNYFNFCLSDIYLVCGYYYSSTTGYLYALTNSGKIYCYGTVTGIGTDLTPLTIISDAISFKNHNTNISLNDKNIVDVIFSYNELLIVYKDNDTLKYSVCGSTSYLSGETISSSNKFQEIIPNENNFNFDRFSEEIMMDSAFSMMYMWEKETNDLYMAGTDYTTGSTAVRTPLTKVELPEGKKAKRLKSSHLYHNFINKTTPTFDTVVTVSMFPDGAFSQEDSGFKVWDGEKYDRALFVDELEEFYELDVTKAKLPIKINTSSGEKTLATTNMILYPKLIEDSNDNELALVGKAIVGKSKI